jgi:hypothetical protein
MTGDFEPGLEGAYADEFAPIARLNGPKLGLEHVQFMARCFAFATHQRLIDPETSQKADRWAAKTAERVISYAPGSVACAALVAISSTRIGTCHWTDVQNILVMLENTGDLETVELFERVLGDVLDSAAALDQHRYEHLEEWRRAALIHTNVRRSAM